MPFNNPQQLTLHRKCGLDKYILQKDYTNADANQLIWTGQLAEDSHLIFTFSDEITLQPGEWLTIAAKSRSGTAAYVNASINTREDQ